MESTPFRWWWICKCGHFQLGEPGHHVSPAIEADRTGESSYRDPCPACGRWKEWERISARLLKDGSIERAKT